MKKNAFTLAEVLITLGIIGVVAAMTMPVLIQNQREKVVVTQLKKVQSVFSQAFLMAVEVNGMAEDWDIGTEDSSAGAQKLYNIMKPYLLKVEDCNLKKGCFYEGTYKSLNGPSYAWQPSVHSVYARGILADGTAFLFWSAGSGCELDASKDGKNWGQPITYGTFHIGTATQTIEFTPCRARYVKLSGLSAHDKGKKAAIAELEIILEE